MSTAGLTTVFERRKHNRVVISGHGLWFPIHGKITVPDGVRIHFYVAHGETTPNAVGMAVENRFSSTAPPNPVETIEGGQEVYNYCLTFGSRLSLGGSLDHYKYDWITCDDVDRAIRLSILFKDSRISKCHPPVDVHWACCREIRGGSPPGPGGKYMTRSQAELQTTGKSLQLVGEDGGAVTHTGTIPGKL